MDDENPNCATMAAWYLNTPSGESYCFVTKTTRLIYFRRDRGRIMPR